MHARTHACTSPPRLRTARTLQDVVQAGGGVGVCAVGDAFKVLLQLAGRPQQAHLRESVVSRTSTASVLSGRSRPQRATKASGRQLLGIWPGRMAHLTPERRSRRGAVAASLLGTEPVMVAAAARPSTHAHPHTPTHTWILPTVKTSS